MYRRRVGHISNAALLGHDLARDHVLFDIGHADADVCELEVELVSGVIGGDTTREGVAGDESVGLDDIFDLHIDEVVE